MATEEHPNRNVNMPMDPGAVEAARQRSVPKTAAVAPFSGPAGGTGSRRQVANGEWIDDRVIILDAPPSPSEDSPPEVEERGAGAGTLSVPGSYDPTKVYKVKLGKPSTHAGRVLSADAENYFMNGDTCTEVGDAIIDAVEVGDIPSDPNASPSAALLKSETTKKRKG